MPQFYPLQSWSMISENGWIFEPVWWMQEQWGGRDALMDMAKRGCTSGWNTIAVHDRTVLAIGGVSPLNFWNGHCTCAVAWTMPTAEAARWPKFTLQWARKVMEVQKSQLIPRVESYEILGRVEQHAPARFLKKVGFTLEGLRACWFRGMDIHCWTIIRPEYYAMQERQALDKMH